MSMQMGQAQEQKMAFTQALCTSVQVLQMDCMELADYLRERSMENPMLELEEGKALIRTEKNAERTPKGPVREDEEFDPLKNVRAKARDFRQELLDQLDFFALEEDVRRTARYIVYDSDTRGYLNTEPEQIDAELQCGLACAKHALAAVQQLEPAGVGARSLKECLLLQLERLEGDFSVERALIERELLLELAQRRTAAIATTLGVERERAEQACAVIRSLNPLPCNGEEGGEPVRYAVPEIEVSWSGTRYEATLIDDVLPRVGVSAYWSGVNTAALDEEARKYIMQNTARAKELVTWVEKRRKTLLRCACEIVAAQQAFFHEGRAALRPMQMKDLAAQLDCHISTVSRALAGKYLECRWGVLELTGFFQRAVEMRSGETQSAAAVQSRIAAIIAEEDAKSPVSDQSITNLLAEQGVQIARRTVAKYREALGFAPAALRKKAL